MKEYTVVIRTDDHGGRYLEVHALVLSAEFEAIKKKLGPINELPKSKLNKKLKIKIES